MGRPRRQAAPGTRAITTTVTWPVVLVVLGVAACERSARSTPSEAPRAADDWRCYVRDPQQPALPQGDVTHTRQRLVEGRLETESVHVQAGRAGATRLVFTPIEDRLEATFGGVTVTPRLLAPDASHWTLAYSDPASGLEFTEESRVAAGVLTVTSTDPGEDGPVTTPVRFVPASCATVVAELAKHPG